MGDCELCGATKVPTREHRVNKSMLAVCPKCVEQMNLAPKKEAPGLAQSRRSPMPKNKKQSMIFKMLNGWVEKLESVKLNKEIVILIKERNSTRNKISKFN